MTRVAELSFSLTLAVAAPVVLLVANAVVFIYSTLRPKAFPPGPNGIPGFGNLLSLNQALPFLTYHNWAGKYGRDTPLGIKRGSLDTVVLNSAHLVREVIEKRGSVYINRPFQFIPDSWIFRDSIRPAILTNGSPWLTRWRRYFMTGFSSMAVKNTHPVYEAETAKVLVNMIESPTLEQADIEANLVRWVLSVPCLAACGRRPDTMGDHGFDMNRFRRCNADYAALLAPMPGDMFPFLRYLPSVFGMADWKKKARRVREDCLVIGKQFVSTAQEQLDALDAGKPIQWESVLSKMLRDKRDNNDQTFTAAELGHSGFHIVSSGISTSMAAITLMLMILAKYPEYQQRIREEVLEVAGGEVPKVTDMPNLRYTEAFWNEALRWRPVAPQAVPHAPNQDDVYEGYQIPKGTAIFMNVWSIHHSEDDYDEPDAFKPERFLDHPFGMKLDEAHDPAYIESSKGRVNYIFGAGRRVCPGTNSAKLSLVLGLAKFVWAFDILPPVGKEIDLNIETGFIQGVAMRPRDFDVILKLRDESLKQKIMDHYSEAYEGEARVMGWENNLYK